MGLQDVISRILVPLEDEIDEKDGVKKVVKRKNISWVRIG